MQMIGILLSVFGFAVNHAFTYCFDYYTSSSCYNTAISDNYVYCYGSHSCFYTEITATVEVHCVGFYTCGRSNEIESTGDSVYCNGDYGCQLVQSITASDDIYCDGDNGCRYAGDLSATNIYCSGDYGCTEITGDISATNYVYCDGKYGCNEVDGQISGSYADVAGFYGGYSSTFEVTNDVICGGRYSCKSATIYAGDDVIVEANYAADTANIYAGDNVDCEAERSCYNSNIVAGDDVFIYGFFGAMSANIEADRVFVHGSYGLYNADVTSKEDANLYVYLYGLYSGYFGDIFCLNGSNCNVYCYCDYSCRSLDVYYYGSISDIYVYPTDCKSYAGTTNPDGVYCPTFTFITSETVEEFKEMRIQQIEASDDYKKFRKEAEEPRKKAEEQRKADQKEAKKRSEIVDKIIEGEGETDKIFDNAHRLSPNGVSGTNVLYSSYGMIMFMMGGLLTFLMMSCYSRCKDQTAKYQPLL